MKNNNTQNEKIDNVKKRKQKMEDIDNEKKRKLEEEIEEELEDDTEERLEKEIDKNNQFNFYQKATNEINFCTIKLRENANAPDKIILKSIIASLRMKKYHSDNDQPSLVFNELVEICTEWLKIFPIYTNKLLNFSKNLVKNSNYHDTLFCKALSGKLGLEELEKSSKKFTREIFNDIIWNSSTESILTPLTSLVLLPFNKTYVPFINNLLQTLPQDYFDFADLDGDNAATLAIGSKRDDIDEIIVNKTSVNSLFSSNNLGESAIYLACWLNKHNLVKIIIEKYNNDLSEEKQKLIWNDNKNLHDILKYLIDCALEKKEDFKFLEKAIKNLFDCYSHIVFLQNQFVTNNEYEETLLAFTKNKKIFSETIESLALGSQIEESPNYDNHQDQIN